VQVGVFNLANPVGGTEVVVRADFTRASGPIPGSWRSFATAGAGAIPSSMYGLWGTLQTQMWPTSMEFVAFSPGSFSSTPTAFQVLAGKLVDGAFEDDGDVVTRVAFQRLGDTYS
jgi:hypothetical protein